jgi:acyl carrier protein
MDQVGITDRFEELGGDSLLAVSIFAEIEQSLAVSVPIAELASSLTIEQLARRMDELVSGR